MRSCVPYRCYRVHSSQVDSVLLLGMRDGSDGDGDDDDDDDD